MIYECVSGVKRQENVAARIANYGAWIAVENYEKIHRAHHAHNFAKMSNFSLKKACNREKYKNKLQKCKGIAQKVYPFARVMACFATSKTSRSTLMNMRGIRLIFSLLFRVAKITPSASAITINSVIGKTMASDFDQLNISTSPISPF